jgi:hypothetical protein
MRIEAIVTAVALGIGSATCVGQSANAWYPVDSTTQYHVKNAWYDLRVYGSSSRIGMQFIEGGPVFFYYFSPTDSVQLQKASAIYASLLTAVSAGAPASVLATGADSYAPTTAWDFISVQVGPN